MIVYDLRCDRDHGFEAWFRNSAAYDAQVAADDVLCPVCGSTRVEKALMAPNLGRIRKAGKVSDKVPQDDAKAAEIRRSLLELRSQVEANCDYVGERFAEEARRIHFGETDPRGIYGETTAEEATSLKEDGVAVPRIPWLPQENS